MCLISTELTREKNNKSLYLMKAQYAYPSIILPFWQLDGPQRKFHVSSYILVMYVE